MLALDSQPSIASSISILVKLSLQFTWSVISINSFDHIIWWNAPHGIEQVVNVETVNLGDITRACLPL